MGQICHKQDPFTPAQAAPRISSGVLRTLPLCVEGAGALLLCKGRSSFTEGLLIDQQRQSDNGCPGVPAVVHPRCASLVSARCGMPRMRHTAASSAFHESTPVCSCFFIADSCPLVKIK